MIKTWDKHSDRRIKTLHPLIRDDVSNVINILEKKADLTVRVTCGLRTFEEQNELYKIGRTEELGRKPVTWVKGGFSYHNYGLAVDVVEILNGKCVWDSKLWNLIANTFNRFGFNWGFDLWGHDKPHFQKTFNMSINDLRIKKKDKDGYIKLLIQNK